MRRSAASTGAAMVGGAMTPARCATPSNGESRRHGEPPGAGPARFHVGGEAGWVDTVYLGAYRLQTCAASAVTRKMSVSTRTQSSRSECATGGIWFDPPIRSVYAPRSTTVALAKQFYRYGRSRALTVRRHPEQVRMRQLVAPTLVLGLISSRRREVAVVYTAVVAVRAVRVATVDPESAPTFAAALPVMHLSWGLGFLQGVLVPQQVGPATTARSHPPLNHA